MKIKTEQVELLGGPYDGRTLPVLEGTRRIVLMFDPFEDQPFSDKRRVAYTRKDGHMMYAGIVMMKTVAVKGVDQNG